MQLPKEHMGADYSWIGAIAAPLGNLIGDFAGGKPKAPPPPPPFPWIPIAAIGGVMVLLIVYMNRPQPRPKAQPRLNR